MAVHAPPRREDHQRQSPQRLCGGLMDIIEIDALRLQCEIGFSQHEIGVKQDVVITLRIGADMYRAGQTDDPADAFNYRTVTKAIIAHVEASSYKLVEALAVSIARIVVVDHSAP